MLAKKIVGFVPLLLWFAAANSDDVPPPCSLNGDLDSSGACRCDPGWRGTNCEALDVLPVAFPQGYGMEPQQTSWGGGVLFQQNQYHLYVSTMTNNCSLRHWTANSRVEHAVSSSVTGPYQFHDVALPTFSHNPKIVALADGRLAMFHIGHSKKKGEAVCHGEEEVEESTILSSRRLPVDQTPNQIHTSISPNGPWVPLTNSTLPPCNNPAPFRHANGSFYIVCNHTALWSSPKLWGPWTQKSQITKNLDKQGYHYEDPELYADKRGFHVLYHKYHWDDGVDCHNATVSSLFFSRDGLTWFQSPTQPFDNSIELETGDRILVATRERPSLVFQQNDPGQPLQLTHLITSVCSATQCPGQRAGCVNCKYDHWDYTLIQPLRV